jgi:hypothetical protein
LHLLKRSWKWKPKSLPPKSRRIDLRIPQDSTKQPDANRPSAVHGNSRSSPIRMQIDGVTSDLPIVFETMFFEQLDYLPRFEVWKFWAHPATTIFSERTSG